MFEALWFVAKPLLAAASLIGMAVLLAVVFVRRETLDVANGRARGRR